jgi:hypothetical protein
MRRGPLTGTLSLLLEPLKQYLIDVIFFRHSKSHYSRSVLIKRTNTHNFGSVISKSFGSWNLQDKIIDTRQFRSPSNFYFSNRFNFLFDAQNLLLVTLAMLSL